MNLSYFKKHIISISIIGIVAFLLTVTSSAQIDTIPEKCKASDLSDLEECIPGATSGLEPAPIEILTDEYIAVGFEECTTGVTSGLEPSLIEILTDEYINSVRFIRAINGDFCELDLETNECSQNIKQIMLGEAIVELIGEKTLSLGMFILDNEIYVAFNPSNTEYTPSFGEIINRRTQLEKSAAVQGRIEDHPEFGSGSRLLPGGLDRHRMFDYRIISGANNTWEEVFLNLHILTVCEKEGTVITVLDGIETVSSSYVVNSVTPYKKYRLIEIRNELTNFVIDF